MRHICGDAVAGNMTQKSIGFWPNTERSVVVRRKISTAPRYGRLQCFGLDTCSAWIRSSNGGQHSIDLDLGSRCPLRERNQTLISHWVRGKRPESPTWRNLVM